jgi:hypothetical protein
LHRREWAPQEEKSPRVSILIVTSNNPPVNALGHSVRQGLVAGK